MVFPTFRPASVLDVVRQGHKLPSGISRHVIPGRALRLNYPLSRLAQQKPRAEKNEWLQRVVDGELMAMIGRFTVGFVSAFIMSGVVVLPFVAGTIGLAAFAITLFFVVMWYRRTPPRKRSAQRMLRRRRKKFLAKRVPKALPPAPNE